MKFDRNTVLGFSILAVLFLGYFFYNSREQAAFQKNKEREQAILDSIANVNRPKADPIAQKIDSIRNDSVIKVAKVGNFKGAGNGTEEITKVSNKVFTVAFTNKGGQPKWIELNKYKNMDSGMVKLAASDFNKISYTINTGNSSSSPTSDLYFEPAKVVSNADGTTTVSFLLRSSDSSGSASSIIHQYTIKPDEYMIDLHIQLTGADLLTQGIMNFNWNYAAAQQESDISFEKQNTQIGFIEDGEFDYHTIGRRSDVNFTEPVKWIGVRQRFFNTFLIAKNNFSSGKIEWELPSNEMKTIVQTTATMQMKLPVQSNMSADFSIFYGPANFHTLKKYDLKLDKLINLGQGMYAFVRPLNRYVILPVWDFFKSLVSNFGIVIALLTLFIRLVISPLTYKSYLSGAKMKALRPEIAKLKEKFGKDQQQMSMEQMKLFREAGVNPLGGCIPALFQIPIFFALYSFFSANPDLRGADFLWAKDLSAFDDLIKFGTNIPLLGGHLSLFTITAVITSLLISLYSMSMTPDQSNPVLKYMPYIFPVFLLFIFNKLPSALTWYYTVSNVITLILQFVIQNYIIDHDKVLANIEANRKKPKTKSKWQEKVAQMQEQQKRMKEAQQKGKR
ncbi:MAG: membrane protein insertase YidC [Chitinophagaceae bacterium]